MRVSTQDFKELLEEYTNDMELIETPTKLALQIPKRINKYVVYYFNALEALGDATEHLEKIYADSLKDYKMNQGEYANISFNASDLTKVLKADSVYRTQARKVVRLEDQIKVLDGMMGDIRALGYAVNNKISISKLSQGINK